MSNCPICGAQDAYIGFTAVECKNPNCKHFKKEDNIWKNATWNNGVVFTEEDEKEYEDRVRQEIEIEAMKEVQRKYNNLSMEKWEAEYYNKPPDQYLAKADEDIKAFQMVYLDSNGYITSKKNELPVGFAKTIITNITNNEKMVEI